MPNTEEWGKGYDFGQIGMMKAIKTAEELGAANERSRIIKLLEEMAKSTFPGDVWHINPFDYTIALIKEENE